VIFTILNSNLIFNEILRISDGSDKDIIRQLLIEIVSLNGEYIQISLSPDLMLFVDKVSPNILFSDSVIPKILFA
jgi:hypothetical protein